MEKMYATIGNTIDMDIEVDGMSDNPTAISLALFRKKDFEQGLIEEIVTMSPVSISLGVALFVFDTDTITNVSTTIYGRFMVEDSEKKINAYFSLKFVY